MYQIITQKIKTTDARFVIKVFRKTINMKITFDTTRNTRVLVNYANFVLKVLLCLKITCTLTQMNLTNVKFAQDNLEKRFRCNPISNVFILVKDLTNVSCVLKSSLIKEKKMYI